MNDLAEIAERALASFLTRAETLAVEAGDELLATIKDAGESLQGLLVLAVEGRTSSGELVADLRQVRETIEGAIAGEVFEAQRDVLELLKDTVLKLLPEIVKLV